MSKEFVEWNIEWVNNHPIRAVGELIVIILSGGAMLPVFIVIHAYLWATGKELLFERND